MKCIAVYITAKNIDEAQSIGRKLIKERLVACVNIFENMQSIYWWNGEICEDSEVVLIAKTRLSNFDKIISSVKSIHSYQVPCIVSFPIENGNPDYIKWIENETRE